MKSTREINEKNMAKSKEKLDLLLKIDRDNNAFGLLNQLPL